MSFWGTLTVTAGIVLALSLILWTQAEHERRDWLKWIGTLYLCVLAGGLTMRALGWYQ